MAGLISVGFANVPSSQQSSQFIYYATRAGGLLATYIFWIFEERLIAYIRYFQSRANELEQSLGYKVFSARPNPKTKLFQTRSATRLLYGAVAFFWLISFFV
jgi:hypothetical protein